MDTTTAAYLSAPSPLLDPAFGVDPWVAAELRNGQLVLLTRDLRELPCEATVPVEGVLRLRIGDPGALPPEGPLLVGDLATTPAAAQQVDAVTVRLTGAGVEATFGADGLHIGAYGAPTVFARGVRVNRQGEVVGFVEGSALLPETRIYGGGEAFQGPDLRGRLRRGVNVECHGAAGMDLSYLTVPFFWTDSGWGVFAHTGEPVTADLGSTHADVAAVAVPGPAVDLFVIVGEPVELLQRYLTLTGRPGRFPSWALGVWTSRCSYLSAAEVEQVVEAYEQADCPLDVVHVDAWVKGNVIRDLTCSWEVDRDRFPEGWSKPVTDRGVRISLWHNSFVLPDTAAGAELLDAGLILRDAAGEVVGTNDMPERMVIDLTDPRAVAWWQDKVATTARAEGASSFKPDFAEEVPPTAVTSSGRTGWQVRNEYAVHYQAATHAALVAAQGTDEVALFCRSGTAGAQRYPCHWVGDTPSSWEGMASALRAMLSLSLSGYGLVSSDIGGFYAPDAFVHTAEAFEAMDPSSYVADVEPELFARWAQLGALSPVMRFHGTGRREPWAYPEPYRTAAIEACRLRVGLRDYLKAAADEAADTGIPMMRPMVLAFPRDRAAQSAQLQYLLGPDILVAPVLQRGGRGSVYAPGGRWEPLSGMPPLEGAGWTELDVPLSAVPAWRRA